MMTPEVLMVKVLQHAERIRPDILHHSPEEKANELEAQGRWMFSLWMTKDLREFTHKDLAEMFLEGMKPVGSVHEECVAIVEAAILDNDEESNTLTDLLDYFGDLT